jgi:hypothetical protein
MNMPTHHHFPSACSNAKPPINHKEKRKQEASLSSDIEKFLAKGGVINAVDDFGYVSKEMTYKEVNDSYLKRT